MSLKDKIAAAHKANEEIQSAVTAVSELIKSDEADDPKVMNCVRSRHAVLQALQSVGRESQTAMVTAQADGNEDAANHQYRKIVVATSRARMLMAESERCIDGDEKVVDGKVSITLVVDDEVIILMDNPTEMAGLEGYFDSPDVSPFR